MKGKQKDALLKEAAMRLKESTHLLITSGAGLGVDSGLPDFRGKEGFWKAYPVIAKKGLSFSECSNPQVFDSNPGFGYAFFGHRFQLYNEKEPHYGYELLKSWAGEKEDFFVFTSNVDDHFRKAGFDENKLYECHGNINFGQYLNPGKHGEETFDSRPYFEKIKINEADFLATEDTFPKRNGKLIRPNILMFGDWNFVSERAEEQEDNFSNFIHSLPAKANLCIIEIGAGNYVPTIRMASERVLEQFPSSNLIRINPRDTEVPDTKNAISLPMGGLEALEGMAAFLS